VVASTYLVRPLVRRLDISSFQPYFLWNLIFMCPLCTNRFSIGRRPPKKPIPSPARKMLPEYSLQHKKLNTPWPESESELYRPSDRRLSAKLEPTCEDRGCHVVSVTNPYGCNLGFLDRSRYFLFQVAPQLYSWGCYSWSFVDMCHGVTSKK
jgi:hypothetical protein